MTNAENYSTKKHFSQQIDLVAQTLTDLGETASAHDKQILERAVFIRDNMLDNLYPAKKWAYGATSSTHNIVKTLKLFTSALECVLEDNGFDIT